MIDGRRGLMVILVFALTGCASHYAAGAAMNPDGFFSGIWHGLVSPFAIITNLFSWLLGLAGISLLDSVQIIERPNTGFGYYVGFVIGLCGYGGQATR